MNVRLIQKTVARITGRTESFFQPDMDAHRATIQQRVQGKSVLVIGGAGSIGSAFVKELLHFRPSRLWVVDLNENGLAELVRDLRSTFEVLPELRTYPIDFSSLVFEKLFKAEAPFDVVANFAALKHVRSEKDPYAIEAMFNNNFLKANDLLQLLAKKPPERFFCVSTDKATNPVSIMGATKKLMEDVIFAHKHHFVVTTARFANVAFSNGSLLDSYIHRFHKNQPIVCPSDIERFFVSSQEAGQLCLLACTLGNSGDIFIPNFGADAIIPFSVTVQAFFEVLGIPIQYCPDEATAVAQAKTITDDYAKGYPVYMFRSDTSGEKPYEEFFSDADVVDWQRFRSLGVITSAANTLPIAVGQVLSDAAQLFASGADKEAIVSFLETHVANFSFIEKGKTLDQKM
jgi:FlaA1/EpsC-like NDP-sugar epimerase